MASYMKKRIKMNNDLDLSVKAYLASIGKKGGASGTGKAKVRGNAEYYRKIVAKRWANAKKKKTQTSSN